MSATSVLTGLLVAQAAGAAAGQLFSGGEQTGVVGVAELMRSTAQVAMKMEAKAHARDASALDEMVDLAKSRVPVDTGRLLNGITGEEVGDGIFEFRASAVHETGNQADYARFVEFGTAGGVAGARREIIADDGFFSGASSPVIRSRRSYRTHSGAPAQPYFYISAHEALEKRGFALDEVALDSARDEGFEVG